MISSGLTQFQLSYSISPIILTGGIAANLIGGILPITNIIEPSVFGNGALSGANNTNLNSYFAHFVPIPGGNLIDNQIGTYPFANQSIAANAIITQPLRVSLMMICPVNSAGGYQAKTQIITALKSTLDRHGAAGGTYSVATPSFLYTNCILTGFADASSGESHQAQNQWRMDFYQPLLTIEAAQSAENLQMSRMSSGLAIPGDPPRANAVGVVNPNVATSTVPASQNLVGANASPTTNSLNPALGN